MNSKAYYKHALPIIQYSIYISMDAKFLNNFARTYYFFSCIKQQEIKISNRKMRFTAPMDGILWYLEVKKAFSPQTAVSKPELMNAVYLWFRETTTLQRKYSELIKHKLIKSEYGSILERENTRNKYVWITKPGLKVLNHVKEMRLNECRAIANSMNRLSEEEKLLFNQFFSKVADTAQDLIEKEIINDPYGNAVKYNLKNT